MDLQRIALVVQDWGGILGLTSPLAAAHRHHGLVVMNTTLGTGSEPLSPGFVAWRDMCAKKPAFDLVRPVSRGGTTMTAGECAA